MTNNTLQFDIINALNEFESFGLDTVSGDESLESFRNHIFKHFDQLRGDLYKIIEPEPTPPKPIPNYYDLLNRINSIDGLTFDIDNTSAGGVFGFSFEYYRDENGHRESTTRFDLFEFLNESLSPILDEYSTLKYHG